MALVLIRCSGVTYTSYTPFAHLPATSFDFGTDGFAGSCNRGGELLQITAPSPLCGFVCAQGDYPNTPDSILARSQRVRGGKSTFGLKLAAEGSDYRLGRRTERGCFNFRWPLVEYRLEREGSEPGTYSLFSFVRDGTLYQVMRLRFGELSPAMKMWAPKDEKVKHTMTITAGGSLRFSCRCGGLEPIPDGYGVEHDASGFVRILRNPCLGDSAQHQALSMQVFVDGKRQLLRSGQSDASKDGGQSGLGDLRFSTAVSVSPGTATVIISTLRFCSSSEAGNAIECPDSEDTYKYVGIGQDCDNATDWLWREKLDSGGNKIEFNSYFSEICVAGRCLERVLFVSSLPVPTDQGEGYALLDCTVANSQVDFQAVL